MMDLAENAEITTQAIPQHTSLSVEFYTPEQIVIPARKTMGGITLDPASCEEANQVVRAKKIWTKEDDGISKRWSGKVWCNPPYGWRDGQKGNSNKRLWAQRMIGSYLTSEIDQGMLLITASVGDKWFYPLNAYHMCLFHFRVQYTTPEGCETKDNQPGSSALIYFGTNWEGFKENFKSLGRCHKGDPNYLSGWPRQMDLFEEAS